MNFPYLFVTLFAVLIANNKAFDYDPTSISTTSEEISFNKDNWIGSSDYLKVSQTPYYIDKTVYIRSVLADSQYVEFGAPRRFTKSTFLSMLENFVSLNITKNGEKIDKPLESASFKSFRNRAVFHDKQGNPLSDEEIEKDDLFRLYFQNYPVIFADFSSICGTTYHRILHTLHCAIVEAFERHNYILNNDTLWFGKYEKEVFLKNYFTRRKDKDVESISECTLTEAFLHLSRKLYQHFGKKVIVLIDDVDAPTTSALHSESFSHQDVENIILIMNSLLTTICKTVYSDQYIEKVLVTSILSSNAVSCQTNFKRYHFLQNKRYEFLFGFTREEVQARIEDNMQSLKTKIETYDENDFPNTMAAWYNGYRSFSNVSIYNPWAVVNVLTKVIFHGSWAVPATVKNFVRLCIHPTILPTIWRLLNQEYVEMKMTRKYINTFEIPMLLKLRKILLERSVWEPSPFFEYLCESGLLFCKPLKYDKMAMKIPNYGIHSSMESLIFSYGDANTVNFIPPELAKNIAERFTALINSNPDELITNLANDLSVLHRTMHATLNEDVKEMGEYYGVDCVEHNFKWALYVILNHHFPEIENGVQRVIKEEPVPGGRIDLVLMTDHFTFIIELKHGSNSQKTLNQCIKNNYSSIMSELPYSDHERAYMLLGINFQKNKEMKVDISYLSNPTDVKSIRTMTST